MKLISRKRAWQLAGLLIADLGVFGLTNATQVASYILIVGFLLLVVTIYCAAYGLAEMARLYGLPVKHKPRLATYTAVFVGLMVALRSIGELNSRDVLVMIPLAFIAYVYSFYGSGLTKDPET